MKELHPWSLSEEEMIWIQEWLRSRVQLHGPCDRADPEVVAILSCGFEDTFHLYTELVLIRYPALTSIGNSLVNLKSLDPYPTKDTLHAFRVVPCLRNVVNNLAGIGLVVVYGYHGICHPRRLGVAAHLGILIDLPTIGVSRDLPPHATVDGDYIVQEGEKIVWGEGLARTAMDLGLDPTCKYYSPMVGRVVGDLYVSPGHMIGVDRAGEVVGRMVDEGILL